MRFYDAQTGDTAETVTLPIDQAVDPMESTDEFEAASGTPTTAVVQIPDTRPTYRLIREARAPKLSLRSNGSLTYQVLTDEVRSGVWLRIAVNHEGGCFSDEAVSLALILDCVRDLAPDAALQALSFKPAFVGRSTCNGGFLAAVLLAEGLLGRDLQTQTREVKVSLEYDFKRRPVNVRMVRMERFDAGHLAFDTAPWSSAEEGEAVRTIFNQWRQENCLKTLEDWQRWQVFLCHHLGNRRRRARGRTGDGTNSTGTRQPRGATGQVHLRGGSTGIIRKVVMTLLIAFTQGQWGLAEEKAAWTYKRLAQQLTDLGYPVSEMDVKNARRSQLNESIAPDVPEIRQFLDRVKELFTGLEAERFIEAT